jgi:molybdate transport system substrate-binding protein
MMSALVTGLVAMALFVSCANTDSAETELNVFAAASLTDAFQVIANRFQTAHNDVDVRLNLLSSSELAEQIEQGAPADVFAAADTRTMNRLADDGLLGSEPKIFTTNRMAIVVAKGNPLGIAELQDLVDPSLIVSLAAPGVPAGDYARSVLSNAGVSVSPDSEEQDVRAVVTRVATGEADAGIVYESDATATGEVDVVPITAKYNIVARYPIAVLGETDEKQLARDFVSFVVSTEAVRILTAHGFKKN